MKYAALVYLSVALLATSTLTADTPRTSPPSIASTAPEGKGYLSTGNQVLYLVFVAEMALIKKDFTTANTYYKKAAFLSDDPALSRKAAELAIELHDPNALSLAKRWATLSPDELSAQMVTFTLLLIEQKSAEAHGYLQNALTIDPKQLTQQLLMLYAYLPDAQKAEIIAISKKLAKESSQKAYPALIFAQLSALQQDFKNATQYVDMALRSHPSLTEALQFKAELLAYQANDENAALLFLSQKVKEFPNNHELKLIYANLLLDHQNPKEVIALLTPLLKQDNFKEPATLLLGESYSQIGNFEKANSLLEGVADTETYGSTARYLLGEISENQHQREKAMQWYLTVKEGPYHFRAYTKIVDFLIESGAYMEAMEILERANPTTLDDQKLFVLTKIDILIATKQFEEALQFSESVLAQLPNDTEILYSHALAALGLSQMQVVENDLKQILTINPKHLQALNALGFLLLNHYRLEEAKMYLTEALQLAPNDPAVLDSMGWLHYRLGDLKTAETFLQRAHHLSQNSEIAAHFGEVLWMKGNIQQALSIWKKALTQNPEHPELLDTISRLKIKKSELY